MSSRERLLMFALIGILVAGVGGYVVLKQLIEPLRDLNSRISAQQEEINSAELALDQYMRDKPKLDAARKRSVPREAEQTASQYNISYLQPMLAKSGLTVEDVSHSIATEAKLPAPVGEIKKTGHQLMTFQMKAKGELGDVVTAIRTIQATPYEHRIKNLTIERDGGKDASSKLTINMMIEVLMVAKTENKELPPATMDLALLPDRNYDDIGKKNIFVGALAQIEKVVIKVRDPVEPPRPPPPPESVPDLDVPALVKLDTIMKDNTAYLRNYVYRTRETKLIAKPGSGYENFRITDEDGSYVFFKGKVLRVEPRDIYFQVYNQVYKLHVGHSLREAMQEALSIDQLDDIDLDYDREWAKKEMDNKKDTTAKKKTTKGR